MNRGEASTVVDIIYNSALAELRQARHKEARTVFLSHITLLPACWMDLLQRAALHYEACFVNILLQEIKKIPDSRCDFTDPGIKAWATNLYEEVIQDFTDRSRRTTDFHDTHSALYQKVLKSLMQITGDRASKAA